MIVYAVNIHTGGGKVLLDALILDQPFGPITKVYADERYRPPEQKPSIIEVIAIKPKLFSRLFAEIKMYSDLGYNQTHEVLFFGNLPPVFRHFFKINESKKFILYLQNAFLIMNFNYPKNSFKEYLRLSVEKIWLNLFKANIDEIWVQTEWMRQNTTRNLNFRKAVDVRPFLPTFPTLNPIEKKNYKFLYVGSLAKHKNLDIFLRALESLDSQSKTSLNVCIILDCSDQNKASFDKLQFKNINVDIRFSVTRTELFNIYRASEFLVCTSSLESFYLPMYEASHFGCKIILPSEISYSDNLPKNMTTLMYKSFDLDLSNY